MLEALETLFYFAVAVAAAVVAVRDRLTSDPTPEERREARLDDLEAQRARGEIDAVEHAQEAEFVLDERNEQIRAVVEDVSRISEARSKAIAREFDSLEDLRGSSRERLESVPDIGESRAENVLDRVREGD